MRRLRTAVAQSNGEMQFIPLGRLWEVSGVLADNFPLDRSMATAPRWSRRAAHWTRLALVDRAVTNREGTAVVTFSATPWLPAVVAGVTAAVVAPWLPAWVRRLIFGAGVVWLIRGRRVRRFVEMRRELGAVAPGAVLVGDFVAREPGAAMPWVAGLLDTFGTVTRLVVLVPNSGDVRRDAARVRLYCGRLGFRAVGTASAGGQCVSILVRE